MKWVRATVIAAGTTGLAVALVIVLTPASTPTVPTGRYELDLANAAFDARLKQPGDTDQQQVVALWGIRDLAQVSAEQNITIIESQVEIIKIYTQILATLRALLAVLVLFLCAITVLAWARLSGVAHQRKRQHNSETTSALSGVTLAATPSPNAVGAVGAVPEVQDEHHKDHSTRTRWIVNTLLGGGVLVFLVLSYLLWSNLRPLPFSLPWQAQPLAAESTVAGDEAPQAQPSGGLATDEPAEPIKDSTSLPGPYVTVNVIMDLDRTGKISRKLKRYGEKRWCQPLKLLDASGGRRVEVAVEGIQEPFSAAFIPFPGNGRSVPCLVQAAVSGVPSGAVKYVARQMGSLNESSGIASVTGEQLQAQGNLITLK